MGKNIFILFLMTIILILGLVNGEGRWVAVDNKREVKESDANDDFDKETTETFADFIVPPPPPKIIAENILKAEQAQREAEQEEM